MRAPDVVGSKEAAEILGVGVVQVSRWVKRAEQGGTPRLPRPAAVLAATRVWHREDVQRLADGENWLDLPEREPLDLLGTLEAAADLHVDKSQIGRWRRGGYFPEPAVQLAAGPLWWRSQIGNFTPPSKRPRAGASA